MGLYQITKDKLKTVYYGTFRTKILMLHHVTDHPNFVRSGCRLDTELFHLVVDNERKVLPLLQLIEKSKLGIRSRCAITFDDGLEDVYTIAYPYLKEREIPFTVFIITDFLDTDGYLTTEQLLEMGRDPLVTIGAHGTNHRILTYCTQQEIEDEIFESKRKLENLLSKKIDIFAYSHGAYDENILKLVRDAEYKYCFSVRGYPLTFGQKTRKYALPRINVEDKTFSLGLWK